MAFTPVELIKGGIRVVADTPAELVEYQFDGYVRTGFDLPSGYDPIIRKADLEAAIAKLESVSVESFGAIPDYDPATGTGTDNSVAFQAAVDEAFATGKILYAGPGHWLLNTQVTLPSFQTTGKNYDEDNPFRFWGAGWNQTHLHYKGTGAYAIAHETIGGTTNRGQNFGVEVCNFTLWGPGDFANTAHGVGIDNTRFAEIHHIAFRGFSGGVGVHLYGHSTGGMFGARVHDCRFGNSVNVTPLSEWGGFKLYNPADLEKWSMRYAIWLDGPYETVGKVNDILIDDNQCYDMLIGMVNTKGHGTWDPETSVGSSANILSRGNVYFMQGSRKIEEGGPTTTTGTGGLEGVPTTTVVKLRTTTGAFLPTMDPTTYYLSVRDPATSKWHRRYVTSWNSGTREATLASALPFTPVAGDAYRVGYADAAAEAEFTNPIALQHVFYWASQYSARSIGDYMEETTWLVAHPDANSDFSLVIPEDVVNDGTYAMRIDGSPWYPRMVIADRPRGSNAAPAQFVSRDILFMHPDSDTVGVGPLLKTLNSTGAPVTTGSVVRLLPTGTEAGLSQGSGSVSQIHVVVASSDRTSFDTGQPLTYAIGGQRPVRVSVAVTAGQLLLPAANGQAIGVDSSLATGEQAAEAVGRAITAGSAGSTCMALIKGW